MDRDVRFSSGRLLGALIAVGWLLLVGACTMAPRYRQPPLPVPDQWPIPPTTAPIENGTAAPVPQADAATSTGSAVASATPTGPDGKPLAARDIGWRDFFVDTRLQQLIATALANNRDLRVALLNVERARGQYRVQRSALLPSIDATGSLTREKLPPAETFATTAFTGSVYQAGIGVTAYEVDLFGRVRSLTRAALELYLAQEEARRGAQLLLIAEVANAYLTLASDRELQRLAQQTLQSQEASYNLAQRSHEAGTTSGLDLAQAQTTVEQARADAARYEGNVAQDIDALTLLVGTPLEAAWLPEQFDASTMGIDALPAEMPSTVLLRRPDVLEAEHTLRSANADVGAARAAFFPQITLTGNFGSASLQLDDLFKAGTGAWTFAPQITLPLFHGGALLGNLAVARSSQEIAVAQYEKAIQSGFREVADALALTSTLNRQRAAQEALVAATGRAYELSQQRYKAGRDSYLNVLDSQRSNYSAEQGLIATRLAEQSNRVTLYESLGGGWREQAPQSTNP